MSEPRSFEERTVGEFFRVNPKGKTDRQLLVAALQQAEATHGCLEKHIAETRLANLDATEKRQALAEDVLHLRSTVATVESVQREQGAQVRTLTLALGAQKPDAGEAKPRAHTEISLKSIGKIVVGVGGSLSLIIFLYQLAANQFPAFHQFMMSLSPT